MSAVQRIRDGLTNVLSGLGGPFDKRASTAYARTRVSDAQIEAAYAENWLYRQCIDAPSFDLFRDWRRWDGEPEIVEALEAEEKRLDVRGKFERAHRMARAWGGALIVIAKGSEDLAQPLEAMGPGALSAVNVVPRRDVTTHGLVDDLTSPRFCEPLYYEYYGLGAGRRRIIHPSRVVRFDGPENPQRPSTGDYWGLSVVQLIDEAINDFMSASANMTALVHEAKIDVFGIPNLAEMLALDNGDAALRRMQANNAAKSTVNAVFRDAEETYEQKQINFSGLPDVVRQLLSHVSAAADVPMTRLAGQSPGGLNATGDGDMNNYLDRLAGEQQNIIRPRLDDFDVWLAASAGVPYSEASYTFAPLKQMSEKEISELTERNAKSLQTMAASMADTRAIDGIAEQMMRASPVFVGADSVFDGLPTDDGEDLGEPLAFEGAETQEGGDDV